MDAELVQVQSLLGERYRVERELGRGGMAMVYLAEDLKHRRMVAVKVLRPELAAAVGKKRFLREIDVAAKLSHPNILPLYDSGEGDGLLYYVMPYVEGESLRDRLNEGGQLPVAEALRIVHAVADALAYAHAAGLVHRDVKPENILFQAEHPVVSDFGIARAVSAAGGANLTDAGLAMGTPAYISPEQAVGDSAVDHRADLYALGVVAYELLGGEPPFVRGSAQRTIAAHVTEAPRPVAELRPSVPPQVAELVMRCLEKDPTKRPQAAVEIKQVLESLGGLELASAVRSDARLAARTMLIRALSIYATAFVAVGATAWAAMMGLGLPDWVFPGSLAVMAAGLPAIFLTAWVHYGSHRTPTSSTTRASRSGQRRLVSRLRPYLTWKRTTLATAAAIVLFALGVSGFMTMRAGGIGPAATLMSAGTLQENERLLIADFDVRGADSALGPALTMVVRAALEQSTAVSVMSQTALAGALERMQRPPSQQLNLELARDLAAREGLKAIVHGELASAGGQFLLTLRLLESESGRTLASFSETTGETRVISAVDDLSRRLRSRIGESLKEVRASPPLERVTTPSLEALHKYTAGYRANYVESNPPKAVQLFQEAVALDTAFAMAWRMLATTAANARMQALHDSALATAFRHRDRASPAERDFITADYYWRGPGRDRAKAVTAYEALVRRDFQPAAMIQLAVIYTTRREFARAESLLRGIVDREPSNATAHNWLILTLFDQGNLAEADSMIGLARSRFPDDPRPVMHGTRLLYHRGEVAAYERALDGFRNSTIRPLRSFGLRGAANLALLRGQLAERERLRAEARTSGALGPEPIMTDYYIAAVIDEHVRRQPSEAIKRLDALLELPADARWRSPFQVAFHVSIEYAIAGQPDRARTILQRYLEQVTDTAALRLEQPILERAWGWVAFAEGRYRDATAHFRRGDMAPDGPADECMGCLPVQLAWTYDAAGQPDSAIAMFEQAVPALRAEMPASAGAWAPVLLPRIYERLGQLHESQGNHDRAARYYGEFIDLWKNADPELQPSVAEARQRLAALTSTGASRGM